MPGRIEYSATVKSRNEGLNDKSIMNRGRDPFGELEEKPADGVVLRRKDRRKPKSGPAVQEQELLSALHK